MLCEQSIVRNNSGLKFQTAVFGWNELLAYHGMDGETSERETIMKNFRKYVLSILLCFTLTGCGQQAGFSESVSAVPENNFTESQTGVPETVMQQTDADAETAEIKSASDNVRPFQRRSPCHAGKNAGWDAGDGNFQTEGKYQSCKSSNGIRISERQPL